LTYLAFRGIHLSELREANILRYCENLHSTLFFDIMDDLLKNTELVQELGGGGGAAAKQSRSLNKALVNELPHFIEATVSTIAMMTNATATKNFVNIQPLSIPKTNEQYASSIGFYGDIDGLIILIFPRTIAKKACELLIGDANASEEEVLDSLAEFVNIIGGRAKVLLSANKYRLDITLPRTYADTNTLLEIAQNKKGVQVDLSFEGEHFIFFLTR
jgi:CheY-specific phosphatase CheX